MDYLSIFLIAIGLSFDTFAVATSSGLVLRNIVFRDAIKISFSFAFFHALMPIAGWLLGNVFKQYIESYDHWIAFGLLSLLGLKMIIESLKKESNRNQLNPLDFRVMISLSIATSIDALVVGISFAIISVNMVSSVLIIGAVTFIVSMLGILFGKKAGKYLRKELDIIGGIILIGLGLKILIEHIFS